MVQTLLFVTGIKTLLQTLFGTRLPTIMGGSYAYVVPILSIIRDPSLVQIADGHTVSMPLSSYVFYVSSKQKFSLKWKKKVDIFRPPHCWKFHVCMYPEVILLSCLQRFLQTMRAIQGSLIVSSSIQIILGYSQLWAICSRYMELSLLP